MHVDALTARVTLVRDWLPSWPDGEARSSARNMSGGSGGPELLISPVDCLVRSFMIWRSSPGPKVRSIIRVADARERC